MYSHPYSQITVETEFDNPIYETGVSGPAAPPAGFPLARPNPRMSRVLGEASSARW